MSRSKVKEFEFVIEKLEEEVRLYNKRPRTGKKKCLSDEEFGRLFAYASDFLKNKTAKYYHLARYRNQPIWVHDLSERSRQHLAHALARSYLFAAPNQQTFLLCERLCSLVKTDFVTGCLHFRGWIRDIDPNDDTEMYSQDTLSLRIRDLIFHSKNELIIGLYAFHGVTTPLLLGFFCGGHGAIARVVKCIESLGGVSFDLVGITQDALDLKMSHEHSSAGTARYPNVWSSYPKQGLISKDVVQSGRAELERAMNEMLIYEQINLLSLKLSKAANGEIEEMERKVLEDFSPETFKKEVRNVTDNIKFELDEKVGNYLFFPQQDRIAPYTVGAIVREREVIEAMRSSKIIEKFKRYRWLEPPLDFVRRTMKQDKFVFGKLPATSAFDHEDSKDKLSFTFNKILYPPHM